MMADLKMSIENCAKGLADARKQYDEVNVEKKRIDSEMTRVTNNLNEAQKTFEAAVNELKADAPWNTKWHGERNHNNAILDRASAQTQAR